MKILSLGNSFGKDAQRYLHRIAEKNGHELKCVNLYIGGCPLRLHYLNMLGDVKNYSFEFNGETTGIYVSLLEALKRCPQSLYRDGMHASLGFRRYLLGLTWYRTLFGERGSVTHLDSFDEPISKACIEAAESVSAAVTADLG